MRRKNVSLAARPSNHAGEAGIAVRTSSWKNGTSASMFSHAPLVAIERLAELGNTAIVVVLGDPHRVAGLDRVWAVLQCY